MNGIRILPTHIMGWDRGVFHGLSFAQTCLTETPRDCQLALFVAICVVLLLRSTECGLFSINVIYFLMCVTVSRN